MNVGMISPSACFSSIACLHQSPLRLTQHTPSLTTPNKANSKRQGKQNARDERHFFYALALRKRFRLSREGGGKYSFKQQCCILMGTINWSAYKIVFSHILMFRSSGDFWQTLKKDLPSPLKVPKKKVCRAPWGRIHHTCILSLWWLILWGGKGQTWLEMVRYITVTLEKLVSYINPCCDVPSDTSAWSHRSRPTLQIIKDWWGCPS